ncbi:MAG: RIO1 family regulatory kinase/ATPase [Candidatus Woesearchaeota archaeon]
MVTVTYAPALPNTKLPTRIQAGIETGTLRAEEQNGVHPTYVVSDGEQECFFKNYTIRSTLAGVLAERMAFAGARESAALFYREPLSWTRVEAGERAAREARALRQWQAIGIDTPRVISHDRTGLVLEAIRAPTLKDAILDATLKERHIQRYVEALHTAREAAFYIGDPSYLHNDPKTENALVTDGRVYLIDPGMLTKNLPVRELDAAFSLAYLTNLEGIVRDAPPDERGRIEAATDMLADAYLEHTDAEARERMLDHAHPVSERHIARMKRVPLAPFQRFAIWLSYNDAEALDRITTRIRTAPQ